jgi:hypothetical protein
MPCSCHYLSVISKILKEYLLFIGFFVKIIFTWFLVESGRGVESFKFFIIDKVGVYWVYPVIVVTCMLLLESEDIL